MKKYINYKIVIIALIMVLICINFTQTSIFAKSEELVIDGIPVKSEKIKTFDGGKLVKIKDKGTIKDIIILDDGTVEDYDVKKHGKYFEKLSKKSKKLQEKIEKINDKDKITVQIWLEDIDQKKLDKDIKEKLSITEFTEKEDKELVQKYIEEKRLVAAEEYETKNKNFFTKYVAIEDVVYVSKYAPVIIANIKKKNIEKLDKNNEVILIELFEDLRKSEEVAFSIPNINADYVRDNINLTGWGVKVGIVEMGYPDKSNAQLTGRNITFDVSNTEASSKISSHATRVTSIIVGNTHGIVPNAVIYSTSALNRLQDYEKIEWLLTQGVNVINYSAGYADIRGQYSDMARWMDHLANQHNVIFVKSSGNVRSGNYGVTDPGMAYNIETIGSINDNDSSSEPDWSDDEFSYFSSYVESTGGYKPDLTAPGQNIEVAGYTESSGTSYAAPHATGVIVQLFQQRYDLRVKPAALKSILATGTRHQTADDYGDNLYSPYYSDKEGAGVIDAKGAFNITGVSKFDQIQLSSNQFPYEKYYYVTDISKPVRVSLAWLKQNELDGSHINGSITDRDLSDLDLYVYDQNGYLVAFSISANNNVEVAEFFPMSQGNYKIVVDDYAVKNDTEIVGIAWD